MRTRRRAAVVCSSVLLLGGVAGHAAAQDRQRNAPPAADSTSLAGQDEHHHPFGDAMSSPQPTRPSAEHSMWVRGLGNGWILTGMAQLHPLATFAAPGQEDLPIHDTELYVTQPAVMGNLESSNRGLVLHGTLNFEAWTQPGGEYTFGGWGEGFIDKRHPHTLLHELTLSLNLWDAPGGDASITVGKGFAPYGTDDPMSRPVVKFPTNHHLSQILERWLVSGAYRTPFGLSVEAGVFGGAEPTDAYDLSNIESFGDSYSARVVQRFGGTRGGDPWELSGSWARVEEEHHGSTRALRLYNAAIRHAGELGAARLYALAEASRSDPEVGEGYWSVLGEGRLEMGGHRPYYRVELATRPEFERRGSPGSRSFYRYDHDAAAVGASRWQIHSMGYETTFTAASLVARPFAEVQYHQVEQERGDFDPLTAFGGERFWSVTAGFKLYLGGDAMRMGHYGVLDPVSQMMRQPVHMH